jgi:hypothetical protein
LILIKYTKVNLRQEALGKKLSQRVDFHSAPFPEFSWSDKSDSQAAADRPLPIRIQVIGSTITRLGVADDLGRALCAVSENVRLRRNAAAMARSMRRDIHQRISLFQQPDALGRDYQAHDSVRDPDGLARPAEDLLP